MTARLAVVALLGLGCGSDDVTDLNDDERIVLPATHASLHADGWRVHLHAWIHEPELDSVRRRALKKAVREAIGVPDDPASRRRFEARVARLLYDNERGKHPVVRLGSRVIRFGPTGKDGHAMTTVHLPRDETPARVEAILRPGDDRVFHGEVRYIPREGLSVISDVDDTIKVTQVGDHREVLANTLYRPFRPVAGMPALYRRLADRGAVFHYVSASPWQLLVPLRAFAEEQGFPSGVFHLRRFRLVDVASLDKITNATKKQDKIEALVTEFPQRRFLFFGDSGERDPEIYGDVARNLGERAVGIFIHNVSGEANDAPRFRAAFRGIAATRWRVFRDATRLHAAIGELLSGS